MVPLPDLPAPNDKLVVGAIASILTGTAVLGLLLRAIPTAGWNVINRDEAPVPYWTGLTFTAAIAVGVWVAYLNM